MKRILKQNSLSKSSMLRLISLLIVVIYLIFYLENIASKG